MRRVAFVTYERARSLNFMQLALDIENTCCTVSTLHVGIDLHPPCPLVRRVWGAPSLQSYGLRYSIMPIWISSFYLGIQKEALLTECFILILVSIYFRSTQWGRLLVVHPRSWFNFNSWYNVNYYSCSHV